MIYLGSPLPSLDEKSLTSFIAYASDTPVRIRPVNTL